MPQFDPFGVLKHHEGVRKRIADGEPGYAQSDVGGQIVSYDGSQYPGVITHASPLPMSISEVIEEMILDVARDEGIASPKTFPRSRAEWMIKDRRAHPSHWKKKHKEADLVAQLLNSQPSLFV